MPAPEIRPAAEADLAAVTDIYAHAVLYGTATFELIPPDLAEMTRRLTGVPVLRSSASQGLRAASRPGHDHTSGRDIQLTIGMAGSTQPMPATT